MTWKSVRLLLGNSFSLTLQYMFKKRVNDLFSDKQRTYQKIRTQVGPVFMNDLFNTKSMFINTRGHSLESVGKCFEERFTKFQF